MFINANLQIATIQDETGLNSSEALALKDILLINHPDQNHETIQIKDWKAMVAQAKQIANQPVRLDNLLNF